MKIGDVYILPIVDINETKIELHELTVVSENDTSWRLEGTDEKGFGIYHYHTIGEDPLKGYLCSSYSEAMGVVGEIVHKKTLAMARESSRTFAVPIAKEIMNLNKIEGE